jgi:hypothetical protein
MEGYCSTGQSPQWAVVPVEEGEEEEEEEEEEDEEEEDTVERETRWLHTEYLPPRKHLIDLLQNCGY